MGRSLHAAWAALYYTRVEITDTQPPAVSGPAPRPDPSGYVRGTQTLTVAASDGSGIRETRLEVDGFTLSSRAHTCDFTYVAPCANEPGAALELDTRGVTDGAHTVGEVAEDAAANVAARSFRITVDNGAPAAPPSKLSGPTPAAAAGTDVAERSELTLDQPGGPGGAGRRPPTGPSAGAPTPSRCQTRQPAAAASRTPRSAPTGAASLPHVARRQVGRVGCGSRTRPATPIRATAAGPVRLDVKRKDPRIRISGIRRTGDRVTVKGRAALGRGSVRVRVQRSVNGSVRRVAGTARIHRGRWARTSQAPREPRAKRPRDRGRTLRRAGRLSVADPPPRAASLARSDWEEHSWVECCVHARLSRKSVERRGTLSGGRRATDSALYRVVIPLKANSAGS